MSKVIIINESNFFKVIGENKNIFLEFFAPWCGPCKMISPVLDRLSLNEELNTKIAKINIDECPNVSDAFQIRKVPSFFFMKDGKTLEFFSGEYSYQGFVSFIKKYE